MTMMNKSMYVDQTRYASANSDPLEVIKYFVGLITENAYRTRHTLQYDSTK